MLPLGLDLGGVIATLGHVCWVRLSTGGGGPLAHAAERRRARIPRLSYCAGEMPGHYHGRRERAAARFLEPTPRRDPICRRPRRLDPDRRRGNGATDPLRDRGPGAR